MDKTIKKCPKCGHKQEVKEDVNVYQDIEGKFTVCGDCGSTYGVEI